MTYLRIAALLLLLALTKGICYAQINYTFEDNSLSAWQFDATNAWDTSQIFALHGTYSLKHILDNTQNGSDKAALYLNTLRLDYDSTVWEFKLRYGYSPSSSNNWAIYLIAENGVNYLTPSQTNKAYLLGVNQTGSNDTLYFYTQNNNTLTEIVNLGINWQDSISQDSTVHFKIIRTTNGKWSFYINASNTTKNWHLLTETENTFLNEGEYFGIYYQYTKTQDQKFWFDDLTINGYFEIDTIAPKIDSIEILNANTLQIIFDEDPMVNILTFKDSITINGIAIDSILEISNKIWNVFFHKSLISKKLNELIIKSLSDKKSNSSNQDYLFYYYRPEFRDIVINEILPDPFPPEDLPEHEFIELKNLSKDTLNLYNWCLSIDSKTYTFPDLLLLPDSLLIITNKDGEGEYSFYGRTLNLISSTTALKNSGSCIKLISNNYDLIDSICYDLSWYGDNNKSDGGWSLERLRSDSVCTEFSNWYVSINIMGGTPGINNSQSLATDNISPYLKSISQTPQNNVIQLNFSEQINHLSNIKINNYFVDSIILINDSTYQIINSSPFENDKAYSIEIEKISDFCQNVSNDLKEVFIPYFGNPGDIIINELMLDPSPSVALPEYEYIELYNTSNYNINLKDWQVWINSSKWILPDMVLDSGSYIIITHNEAVFLFDTCISAAEIFTAEYNLSNESGTIKLTNTLHQTIDSIYYNASEIPTEKKISGGISLERNSYYNKCINDPFWIYSENSSGGTPGLINSIPAEKMERLAIDTIWTTSPKVLRVQFNKPVIFDSTSILNITINNAAAATFTQHDQGISFSFSDLFKIEKNKLFLTGITDLCYNIFNDTVLNVEYLPIEPLDLIVTEIMFYPTDKNSLKREYIEVYNNSGRFLFIDTLELNISNKKTSITNISINSQDYIIITDIEYATEFKTYDNVYFTESFPTLSNNASDINLIHENKKIFSTKYNIDWYSNSKSDGGWSIELIDLNNPCFERFGWNWSYDVSGGTPGKKNNPEVTLSTFNSEENMRLVPDNYNSASIFFNELVWVDTFLTNPVLTFEPSLDVENTYFDNFSASAKIIFTQPLKNNTEYYLTKIDGFNSCNKEEIILNQPLKFQLPEKPGEDDILISEILLDVARENKQFIEIFNNATVPFDLSEVNLHLQKDDTLHIHFSLENKLLWPNEYAVITSDKYNIMEQFDVVYPERIIENTLFKNVDDDNVFINITSNNNAIIDKFIYSSEYHFPMYNDFEDISLERVSFSMPTQEKSNWHSASQLSGFATPGYENSQHNENVSGENNEISLEYQVFSPDNDGYNDVLPIHFNLGNQKPVLKIDVYDPSGRLVRHLTEIPVTENAGTVYWDGVNLHGEIASTGMYMVVASYFTLEGKAKVVRLAAVLGKRY